MYVMDVPVLNTAHIRPETAAFLTDDGKDNLGVVATYDDGWFIFVGDLEGLESFEHLPDDLQKVLQWAFDNGYEWVRLDAHAGDIVDDLQNYMDEW